MIAAKTPQAEEVQEPSVRHQLPAAALGAGGVQSEVCARHCVSEHRESSQGHRPA